MEDSGGGISAKDYHLSRLFIGGQDGDQSNVDRSASRRALRHMYVIINHPDD